MRIFVETLKRLYINKQVTKEKINQLLEQNKISEEENEYILKH